MVKVDFERERRWWDAKLFEEFVDLCERFDREILPEGPGTCMRAGLLSVAEPEQK
jgi:hypothetical protein